MSDDLIPPRGLALAMLLVLTLALSGCARVERGQTLAEATALVDGVLGLRGEVLSEGSYSGVVFDRWSTVTVSLDEGFEISNQRAVIEWLVRTAWSANEDRPNRGVSAQVEFDDIEGFRRWERDADTLKLDSYFHIQTRAEAEKPRVLITVWNTELDKGALGPWPGEFPMLSENAIQEIPHE